MDGPTELATGRWPRQVHGALMLAACGDALGAPFEGRGAPEPTELDQWLDDSVQPLRWTDDTALMLVLAEHLTPPAGHDGPGRARRGVRRRVGP